MASPTLSSPNGCSKTCIMSSSGGPMVRLMSSVSSGSCPRARSAARQLAKMPGCESIKVPSRSRRTEQVMIRTYQILWFSDGVRHHPFFAWGCFRIFWSGPAMHLPAQLAHQRAGRVAEQLLHRGGVELVDAFELLGKIGRASCRERV